MLSDLNFLTHLLAPLSRPYEPILAFGTHVKNTKIYIFLHFFDGILRGQKEGVKKPTSFCIFLMVF